MVEGGPGRSVHNYYYIIMCVCVTQSFTHQLN